MHIILVAFLGRTVNYVINGTGYKYKTMILIRLLKHFEIFIHSLVWTYSGYRALSTCNTTLRHLTWYFHYLHIWGNEGSVC